MNDLTTPDLSMSERIKLGYITAELSVDAANGVLELFAELDDPEYGEEDFKALPSWVTGENPGNGVCFYTSDLGKMRDLVEVAAEFLGVKRPDGAGPSVSKNPESGNSGV